MAVLFTGSPAPPRKSRWAISCNMDFFDLMASTPPRGKKRKIGEHGESPPLTPDMKNCEGAHSMDVKNDVFEEEQEDVKNRRRPLALFTGSAVALFTMSSIWEPSSSV